ncbi:MAG TPA: hypothetical protein VK796_07890 [Cytophaga sp.]|jgi:hypothetical protein|nr:hypothetical protein [Cytophaga sp.]
MKSFYFLLILAIGIVSCRTKQGEPGPSGASILNQQGSVSGTITYSINDGTTNVDSVPFKYIYYTSLDKNKFYFDNSDGDYYELSFERRDSKDDNNYFDLDCYGNGTDGVENDPNYINVNFSFVTIINNKLYEFDCSDGTVTNFKLDSATGRATFDYTNDSVEFDNGTASITLKVDVILYRSSHDFLDL